MGDELLALLVRLHGIQDELDFYRSRAFTLSSLRGRPVEHEGAAAGVLTDVVVGGGGELLAVVVQSDGERRRIPFDDTIRFAPKNRSAA